MESEKQTTERETPPQTWRSWKLIIDPALTKGLYKVCRYDGQHFNIPVEDLGLFPVGTVRDPRICCLWSKSNNTDLLIPKFKVDKWYVGPVPPKEVTFSRLNDNVKEMFLINMCKKHGNVEEVEIFYHPKNKKHLGIAKVIFDTVKGAKDAVQHLHQTSVMGNIIHVEIDPKGENRARYVQLLLNGVYTPWTLPVGSSEQALQSLLDSLLGSAARQGIVSSPTSIATPLSLDTAYSSIWQDTPCSFGLTPPSQGTPHTPCLSATPLSQDSCYSSLQATPVLQGEPSTSSVHKPFRQELWHRKSARHHRGFGQVSNINLILKHCQQQTPYLFSNRRQTNRQQLALWNHNAQYSPHDNKEPSFNFASPIQESGDTPSSTSGALPLKCNSLSILGINFTPDQQTIATSPPDDHRPESLDSRIESLLINSQITDPSFFDRETLDVDAQSQDSPSSPSSALNPPFSDDSQFCTQISFESVTSSHQQSYIELEDVSPGLLDENEDDETIQAVSFLTRNSKSPPSDLTPFEKRAHVNKETDTERSLSLCQKDHRSTNEDKEHSNSKQPGALRPMKNIASLPQPQPVSSFSSTPQHLNPKAPLAVTAGCHQGSVTPFPFPLPPFPPSLPPVPPRLPNGAIPVPPPGWVPHLGNHTGISIPPPPIPPHPSVPPPPTFLGPPPPLMMPSSVPHPVQVHPSPMQPAGPSDKTSPPRHGSALLSFLHPPWPAPPFYRFNPFVPPPDYTPVQENSHKITAEKVLQVIMDELRLIIKKDITRRMIEAVAFKAFEEWWDCQEEKTKIQVSPLKSGATGIEDRKKFINPISQIGDQCKKPPLPSFKVKRKRSEEMENEPCSAQETSDVKQGVSVVKSTLEKAKRRHARPLELDSDDEEGDDDDDDDDDDEGKKEDNTLQDGETVTEKVEAIGPVDGNLQFLSDRNDDDDDDDDASNDPEEENKPQEQMKDEDSQTTDGVRCSDSETSSESSASEESKYSSTFDSSDSFSSVSFEESSSDLNSEDMEDDEDSRCEEYIVISSDEDSMELETPLTPSAPLTPNPDLQDWSDLLHKEETEENQYTSCYQDTCDFSTMMELQTSRPKDLQPPSPIGLAALEPVLDMEIESPEWTGESQANIENLRPLTPTGCLIDSDPDILVKSKPTSPALEEVERPQTPGKGIVADLENEDTDEDNKLLSLSPASSDLVLPPSHLLAASYPSYQEMPRTPGREERSVWTCYSSARAPATPGRETTTPEGRTVCPPLSSPQPALPPSSNPYITAPKTPGRDIKLPRRSVIYKKKRRKVTTSIPWLCNNFDRSSPITVSAPCRLSESSSDTAGCGVWRSSGVRAKPLQGLENMPGILNKEKFLLSKKHWRRLERKRRARHRHRLVKRITGSLSSNSRPHRWRSRSEERRVLHRVWKEGLDEEDARLLQCTYERLQDQHNGFGWLSDMLWIPHPLTKVLTENSEEHISWQHRTGSARSEGFYKISKKDKMKYLNTKPPSELPSTSTQGACIPAQQPTSLRAGSDFRSEQRRLLSSFSCDSDLVKFNQLKFRKKRIRFSRSHIHEWGLFAMEPIAADEMVIEYVGQVIRQVIADMREQRYEEGGIGSSYLFRIDDDTIIDATKFGNLARFINHSCNPNCYAKIITVESQKKIVIYSRQPISINEEITYDYKFPIEETKIPCLCGEDSCRGSLN